MPAQADAQCIGQEHAHRINERWIPSPQTPEHFSVVQVAKLEHAFTVYKRPDEITIRVVAMESNLLPSDVEVTIFMVFHCHSSKALRVARLISNKHTCSKHMLMLLNYELN